MSFSVRLKRKPPRVMYWRLRAIRPSSCFRFLGISWLWWSSTGTTACVTSPTTSSSIWPSPTSLRPCSTWSRRCSGSSVASTLGTWARPWGFSSANSWTSSRRLPSVSASLRSWRSRWIVSSRFSGRWSESSLSEPHWSWSQAFGSLPSWSPARSSLYWPYTKASAWKTGGRIWTPSSRQGITQSHFFSWSTRSLFAARLVYTASSWPNSGAVKHPDKKPPQTKNTNRKSTERYCACSWLWSSFLRSAGCRYSCACSCCTRLISSATGVACRTKSTSSPFFSDTLTRRSIHTSTSCSTRISEEDSRLRFRVAVEGGIRATARLDGRGQPERSTETRSFPELMAKLRPASLECRNVVRQIKLSLQPKPTCDLGTFLQPKTRSQTIQCFCDAASPPTVEMGWIGVDGPVREEGLRFGRTDMRVFPFRCYESWNFGNRHSFSAIFFLQLWPTAHVTWTSCGLFWSSCLFVSTATTDAVMPKSHPHLYHRWNTFFIAFLPFKGCFAMISVV